MEVKAIPENAQINFWLSIFLVYSSFRLPDCQINLIGPFQLGTVMKFCDSEIISAKHTGVQSWGGTHNYNIRMQIPRTWQRVGSLCPVGFPCANWQGCQSQSQRCSYKVAKATLYIICSASRHTLSTCCPPICIFPFAQSSPVALGMFSKMPLPALKTRARMPRLIAISMPLQRQSQKSCNAQLHANTHFTLEAENIKQASRANYRNFEHMRVCRAK